MGTWVDRTRAAVATLVLSTVAVVPVLAHPAGPSGEGAGVAPSGRRVTPAGDQVRVGRVPQGMAMSPDGTHIAVANTGTDPSVSWIDADTLEVLTVVPASPRQVPPREFHDLNALSAGVAFSSDGSRLWVAGGLSGKVLAFDITPAGPVQDHDATIETGAGYVGRLAISGDGSTLYATDAHYRSGSLIAIDPATETVTRAPLDGHRPFGLAVGPDRVYVTGMQSGDLLAFDGSLAPLGSVQVGAQPVAVSVAGEEVLVADPGKDELVVVDAEKLKVDDRIPLNVMPGGLLGASPNDISVSGDTAAVSLGGANGVAILDRAGPGNSDDHAGSGNSDKRLRWELRGLVPAGFTPEAVQIEADGQTMWVANARGDGSGTPIAAITSPGPSPVTGLYGTVGRVALTEDLLQSTAQVIDNNTLEWPVEAERPPIEHVVFILRENKTFDSLLGDTEGGDPRFVVFPRPNTPTLHELADRFAVMTDLHANAEASDQGHQWATGGYVNDFVQRFTAVFPRDNDCMTAVWGCGNDPITYPESGYLFDALESANLSWRVYGEWLPLLSRRGAERPEFADNRVAGYPGYDLSVPDTERAALWKEDFEARGLPAFSFIYLPADHGLTVEDPEHPTLQQQVADNDRATGEIIETISNSPYWEKTAIFLTEDDPQGYFDHVDAQRTIGLVVSPWARRGTFDMHTDTVGLVRTMMWLLGLPPISAFDATTPPLVDVFGTQPDLTPFVAPPEGIGTPPSPLALAEALRLIEALPVQTGPDQIEPWLQLEITSLSTRGLTAEAFARSLGIDLDSYVETIEEEEEG